MKKKPRGGVRIRSPCQQIYLARFRILSVSGRICMPCDELYPFNLTEDTIRHLPQSSQFVESSLHSGSTATAVIQRDAAPADAARSPSTRHPSTRRSLRAHAALRWFQVTLPVACFATWQGNTNQFVISSGRPRPSTRIVLSSTPESSKQSLFRMISCAGDRHLISRRNTPTSS